MTKSDLTFKDLLGIETKDLTVKELHDLLEPLLEEYGDLEIRVRYDAGYAATPIKPVEPEVHEQPMREYSYVTLEGY